MMWRQPLAVPVPQFVKNNPAMQRTQADSRAEPPENSVSGKAPVSGQSGLIFRAFAYFYTPRRTAVRAEVSAGERSISASAW